MLSIQKERLSNPRNDPVIEKNACHIRTLPLANMDKVKEQVWRIRRHLFLISCRKAQKPPQGCILIRPK
jgi:hypothetical protein